MERTYPKEGTVHHMSCNSHLEYAFAAAEKGGNCTISLIAWDYKIQPK